MIYEILKAYAKIAQGRLVLDTTSVQDLLKVNTNSGDTEDDDGGNQTQTTTNNKQTQTLSHALADSLSLAFEETLSHALADSLSLAFEETLSLALADSLSLAFEETLSSQQLSGQVEFL